MVGRKEGWIRLWKLIRCGAFHTTATLRRPPPTFRFHSYSPIFSPASVFEPLPFTYSNCFCSAPQFPTCWNCNARSQQSLFLLCDSCQAIQPLHHSLDYFSLFGLEKSYDMKGNLDRKYKDWQKKLHPDLVHTKSLKEREFAAEQSSRITDAHRTLTNPRSRAIYMIKLKGVGVNEEETISEPQLLAEIMEIREAVEEASGSEALTDIQTLMREKLQQWASNFGKALESHKLEEARRCIQRMTYYDRVNEEIVKRL